jgi:hypothetical protein
MFKDLDFFQKIFYRGSSSINTSFMKTSHVFHFKMIVLCSNYTRDCCPTGREKIRQFYDLPKYYNRVQAI